MRQGRDVLTGKRTAASDRLKARRLSFIAPMIPTLVDKPPQGDDWATEAKFDGWRCQIVIDALASASSPGAASTGLTS